MSATSTTRMKSGPGETRWHWPHRAIGDRAGLERRERFGALAVERDFDDRGQAAAEPIRRQKGDPALDDARIDQRLDAAQAGRRRDVDALGERLVGERGVGLEGVEDLQVDAVEVERLAHRFNGLRKMKLSR
jgi:hypothetical protein